MKKKIISVICVLVVMIFAITIFVQKPFSEALKFILWTKEKQQPA